MGKELSLPIGSSCVWYLAERVSHLHRLMSRIMVKAPLRLVYVSVGDAVEALHASSFCVAYPVALRKTRKYTNPAIALLANVRSMSTL
jgi:hypothetical protein